MYGIGRFGLLHIHFRVFDTTGRLRGTAQMRYGSEVIIISSASHARDEGLVSYRPSNDVILSTVGMGVIPPRFARRVL